MCDFLRYAKANVLPSRRTVDCGVSLVHAVLFTRCLVTSVMSLRCTVCRTRAGQAARARTVLHSERTDCVFFIYFRQLRSNLIPSFTDGAQCRRVYVYLVTRDFGYVGLGLKTNTSTRVQTVESDVVVVFNLLSK